MVGAAHVVAPGAPRAAFPAGFESPPRKDPAPAAAPAAVPAAVPAAAVEPVVVPQPQVKSAAAVIKSTLLEVNTYVAQVTPHLAQLSQTVSCAKFDLLNEVMRNLADGMDEFRDVLFEFGRDADDEEEVAAEG
jgi:hypothetical protein